MKDFKESFLEKLSSIIVQFDMSNFLGCSIISSDILRYSDFVSFADGVMIGEIYESIFANLQDLSKGYEIEKEDLLNLKETISDSIKVIIDSNLDINDEYKIKIYNTLSNLRYKVTRMQLEYFTVKKPKSKKILLPKIGDIE